MTLTLVAMAITAELVLEAQRRLAHSGRTNLDMSMDLAFDQMGLDVRGSVSFDPTGQLPGIYADGSTRPVVLNGHFSGDVVVYELVDTDLRRVVYDPKDLTPKGHRIVLQNVPSFRWRLHPETPGTLEMEVTQDLAAEMTALVAAGQRESLAPRTKRTWLMVTPRGVGGLGATRW